MKKSFLLALLIIPMSITYAQKTIAVLTGSNWTFYNDFSTALNQCAAGSTIYLPGGVFQMSHGADTINKTINIIGVGHYPDSTVATSRTVLDGTLYFSKGSDNFLIQGLELIGRILVTPGNNVNNVVNNVTLNRCLISGDGFPAIVTYEHDSSYLNNMLIHESILKGTIRGDQYTDLNLVVTNSMIIESSTFAAHNGATFRNNILFFRVGCSGCFWTMFSYCVFENNVIGNYAAASISQSVFRNNLFLTTATACSGCVAFTNNLNSTLSNTFINAPAQIFDYSYNYNLLPSSVGNNSGTDGTDIGIFGSQSPYKASAVPPNPHISLKSIAPASLPNGTLPVSIRVIAQDN